MRKRLTNNWGLKLASFLFATILWLIVVNIDNPVKTKEFDNITVKLQNTNILTDSGMVYEVLDNTDSVSVKVSAPRSYLDSISQSDIVAVADFNNITAANTVEITYYSKRNNDRITNFKSNIESVKLSIEKEKSLQLVLKSTATGEVEKGYMVGRINTDQNQIRISGPESIVSQISKAVVSVDVTGSVSDIATYEDVVLYDADENIIEASSLKKNVDTVKVSVEILATKTIPINYNVLGNPAHGYRTTGVISSKPSEVLVAGTADALKNVTKIDVPADVLNITGQVSDYSAVVNVKSYLPEGVKLADSSFSGKAAVTVHIEEEQKKSFTIQKNNISLVNVPEGFTAALDETEEIPALQIVGLKSDVSAITEQGIAGTADIAAWMQDNGITELEEGLYSVEVQFGLDSSITVVEPVTVRIVINKLEDQVNG